jgi:tetratricopeptide (TPR) repeat protein
MAHVFTLEATDHLVPRWFSEGVSVFEEWATGPLPGRHIPISVIEAMTEDKFLPVADLDSGFIRPSYQNQVIVSYMQAGLICEFIAERWGQQALVGMLQRFRQGDDTRTALEQTLDLSAATFDELFGARVEAEFGSVLTNLEAWQAAQAQLHEHAQAGAWVEAMTAAREAIELYPDYVDEGSAYLILARALVELQDKAEAEEVLAEYRRRGGYDPGALLRLGRWLVEDELKDEAIAVYEDLLLVSPLNMDLHAELGDMLLEAGRPVDALRAYESFIALEPHDMASAHLRLARAWLAQDERDRANEQLLYALEIAPHYREAQQLLLEIVGRSSVE